MSEVADKLEDHPMAGHLGFLLRRVQLAVFSDFQRRTAAFKMTPTEYSILEVLKHEPDMPLNRLAAIIGVKPANCVVLIDGLEKRALLVRHNVMLKPTRGRALALRLTPDGKKTLRNMSAAVRDHQRFLIDLLGGQQHEQLREALILMLGKVESGLLG